MQRAQIPLGANRPSGLPHLLQLGVAGAGSDCLVTSGSIKEMLSGSYTISAKSGVHHECRATTAASHSLTTFIRCRISSSIWLGRATVRSEEHTSELQS